MYIECVKQKNKLIPIHPKGQDLISKLAENEVVALRVEQDTRNAMFHRKYFALLECIFNNQDKYKSIEEMRKNSYLDIGHVEVLIRRIEGQQIKIEYPASISFAKMSQKEFEKIYSQTLDWGCQLIGVEPDVVEQELINFF